MYSCEKNSNEVIDPVLHFPIVTNTYYTPQQFNSDSVLIYCGATVQSEDAVQKVEFKFYDLGNNVLAVAELFDNGIFPDTSAGDGKYNGVMNYVFPCRQVGFHKVEFLATNVSGLTSNPIQNTANIIRVPNLPPVVSDLVIVPDSIQVNNPSFFIFMISAVDPNGPCDISKVFYTGFRPNGVPLTSSLELFDDGSCCPVGNTSSTSGDTAAGDNKFTRKTFGAPSETGYYRYYIRAVDRTGDTSNVLADSIYVY